MNANGITIGFACSLLTSAGVFVKIITDYTRIKFRLEELEKREREERERHQRKFEELYSGRLENHDEITRVKVTLDSIVSSLATLDKKFDELRKDIRGRDAR